MANDELTVIELTEENIESMFYEIRGQKVMLDFDLARIYGYDTKYLNRQVQRNIEKFPEDFMFRLIKEEWQEILKCQFGTSQKRTIESEEVSRCQNVTTIESEEISRSQIVTAKNDEIETEQISMWKKSTAIMQTKGMKGGRTSLPYAFTEQGIYMLMTVLKGELAVKQSKALIRLFKKMKDYIVESNNLLTTKDILELSNQVHKNTKSIVSLKRNNSSINNKLTIVMDNFIDPSTYKHFFILDGQKIEADIAYQNIYSLAKHTIHIIDDYINLKTLFLLRGIKSGVEVILLSDNAAKDALTKEDIESFSNEYNIALKMIPTNYRFHDRFIILDYKSEHEIIYHCGASSKDAGKKITVIQRFDGSAFNYQVVDEILAYQ